MSNRALLLALALHGWIGSALAHGDPHPGGDGRPGASALAAQTDWGIAGDRRRVTRTVNVMMDDSMRFTPDALEVRRGETVRFVVANRGLARHEMVIGSPAEIDAHAALMAKYPNMEHDAAYMTHVAPGKTGEIVWTFNRSGRFAFACLVGGHYQAGMRGRIVVRP